MIQTALVVGTCDTKYSELALVKSVLEDLSIPTQLVDVSTRTHSHSVDVSAKEILDHGSAPLSSDEWEDRGAAISFMADALETYLLQRQDMSGVIGLGGSGGTALITQAMRSLPIGLPKVMVSTVASGNVAPYVDVSDICMINSVTDIAGINQISHTILTQAAHALGGMVRAPKSVFTSVKPLLGMTMFGVTTNCVNQIRARLSDRYDPIVFHATGNGGRAMEKMIASGLIPHVIDITTTEICDLHMGGVMSAGEQRLDAIIDKGIPYILSVGALDMVNFGAMESVPTKYKDRLLYKHNAQVTLMRTTPEENQRMAQWMAKKLNRSDAPVRLFLPLRGVSALSVDGQAFYDPRADQALFETLKSEIQQTDTRRIIELDTDINSEMFSQEVVKTFEELVHAT
jgi:uncharacterized protein (UPF0261 family)